MNTIIKILVGLLIFPVKRFFPVKKDVWIFGSDLGQRYSQNSKFLFEYIRKNYNIECFWITQSEEVYQQLKLAKIPVLHNYSLKGIVYALTAEYVVFSTWFNDIMYAHYNKRRFFVYLMHGMPAKKVYYDHAASSSPATISNKINSWIYRTFIMGGLKLEYMNYIPVTSMFFQKIVSKATRNENIYVAGQPRTDAFYSYDKCKLKKKYGFSNNDFIITYMPTHRSYGYGQPSPKIFANNQKAVDYFNANSIMIVWKQHINMLSKYESNEDYDCFVDLSSKPSIDSQELLYISDILITDYSSCFIDYMLLNKPIIFYHYDDYVKNDNSVYLSEKDMASIGYIVKTEDELLSRICQIKEDKKYIDYANVKKIFYELDDPFSSERIFQQVIKLSSLGH